MRWLVMLTAMLLATPCMADMEAPSHAVLFSNDTGRYYVKSIPKDPANQTEGVTKVYLTKAEGDQLLCEYPWYSARLWLFSDGQNLILIRSGSWHRSGNPPEKELEIGFYKDGKTIKEYSALEIAGKKESFIQSSSHYQITSRFVGPVMGKNSNYFEIHLMDNRDLRFDLYTGALLKAP